MNYSFEENLLRECAQIADSMRTETLGTTTARTASHLADNCGLACFNKFVLPMLARLLRRIYLFQLVTGVLIGAIAVAQVKQPEQGALVWLWVLPCAMVLPLLMQWLVICISMYRSCEKINALWWGALWGEYRAALTVYVMRMPWATKCPGILPPLPSEILSVGRQPVPVLLVHGFICNHRVWNNMAHALRQAGHPVLMIDLEPLFTSIDNYTALIEQAVVELLLASRSQQIALVGHSMGGLAIRAWLRAYGAKRVASIITLGTPHKGTRIANAALTPNGTQMVWHSPWLQELERSESQDTRHLIHTAITPQDNIVYPQREQVLSGAQVKEFAGRGHLELCLAPEVIQWVVEQLANR
jgi:hypothetical protein